MMSKFKIKFKIWEPQDKEMYGPYTMYEIIRNYDSAIDLIFLRYTGFKDMLNEEIYEGDLLEDGYNIINTVQFNDAEGQWWITPDDLRGWSAVPLSQFLSDNPGAEVVGNKHTTQMFTYCHDSKLWKKSV
jgi:hypothetical protein